MALVISSCFSEDGKEMYRELYRTYTTIVLLIKPFCFRTVVDLGEGSEGTAPLILGKKEKHCRRKTADRATKTHHKVWTRV